MDITLPELADTTSTQSDPDLPEDRTPPAKNVEIVLDDPEEESIVLRTLPN